MPFMRIVVSFAKNTNNGIVRRRSLNPNMTTWIKIIKDSDFNKILPQLTKSYLSSRSKKDQIVEGFQRTPGASPGSFHFEHWGNSIAILLKPWIKH